MFSLAKIAVIAAMSIFSSIAYSSDAEIKILMAGEAYDGPPAFEVRMGGKMIGNGYVTTSINTLDQGRLYFNAAPQNYIQLFVLRVPQAAFDPKAELTLALTNDRYRKEGRGRDRNLFIQSISINGKLLKSGDIELRSSGTDRTFEYLAGFVPIYEQGEIAAALAPTGGWPLNPPLKIIDDESRSGTIRPSPLSGF